MININNSNRIYLEWSGNCVSNDDYVELSATFATKLGFLDDQTVLINIIDREIKKANEIIIQPNSEFDWENFRLYSTEIESNFLSQMKIVWSNLVLPIWPTPDVCIYLKIHFKDTSEHLLRLETFTELIGVIDEREIRQLQQSSSQQNEQEPTLDRPSESALASFFKFLPQIKLNHTQKASTNEPAIESYVLPTLLRNRSHSILNVINGRHFVSELTDLNKLNTVYVSSNQFQAKHQDRSIGRLIKLLSPHELNARKELVNKKGNEKSKNDLNEENQYLETVVEINFIEQCPSDCLIACNSLTLQLDLYPFSKVVLNSISQPKSLKVVNNQKLDDLTQKIDNLNQRKADNTSLINLPVVSCVSFSVYQTIANLDQISSSISSFVKDYCTEHHFLILNRSTLIKFGHYEFTFQPEFSQNDYVILTDQSVQNNLEIRILNQLKSRLKTSWNVELPRTNLDQVLKRSAGAHKLDHIYRFENYQVVLETCSKMIDECIEDLRIQPNVTNFNRLIRNKIVLIYGKKGCGKTTLINDLVNEFNLKNEKCSLIHLDCAKLKGRKIELLKKNLFNNLNESIYSQPCLLVIENLHILLPKISNVEQEHKLDLLYNQKVKLILIDLIENYLKGTLFAYGSKLFTVVTSRSDDLFENQNLELDMFDEILELKAPSQDCCIKLINHLVKSKLQDHHQIKLDQIDFNQLAGILKTELTDCLPLDLNLISERIIMNSLNENASNSQEQELNFKLETYLKAFDNYVPFNLRSIKSKNKFRNKKLDDLGGLDDVKERLKQIILWPIKYPALFENYPIEPQTCVLLYGMPGTGKCII